MDLPEAGPLRLHLGPALAHQVEDVPRTVVGVRESVGQDAGLKLRAQVVHHLLVLQLLEGLLPGEGEDLPEGDAERPDVALCRIFALESKDVDTTSK